MLNNIDAQLDVINNRRNYVNKLTFVLIIGLLLIVVSVAVIYTSMPSCAEPVTAEVVISEPEEVKPVQFMKIVKQYKIVKKSESDYDVSEQTDIESNIDKNNFPTMVKDIMDKSLIKISRGQKSI